jgi:hypothetical protein
MFDLLRIATVFKSALVKNICAHLLLRIPERLVTVSLSSYIPEYLPWTLLCYATSGADPGSPSETTIKAQRWLLAVCGEG